MTYPSDANGDAVRRMEAEGDDLTKPRSIDFNVVFADESSTEKFAQHFRALGHEASVEATETKQGYRWDVVVAKRMVPSYDEIASFEGLLQSVAARWNGRNDGWGCFSAPSSTS